MSVLRRDGRERIVGGGARPGAAGAANIANFIALSTSIFIGAVISNVSAFGVVPAANPRSMDNLVLGTVALPNLPSGDPNQLLDDAYERGFRRFDLARTYGLGKSEKIFGKWMDEASKFGVDREEICVVTKGGMGNDKYGDPGKHFRAN